VTSSSDELPFRSPSKQTVDNHYRSDLIGAAMKKWVVLNNMRRVKEGVSKGLKSGNRASKK
jgi:hypothetical protein